jgi:glucose/arabinose dehydrogenase
MEEWEKGRPQGVAISSDGSLSAAPASTLTATTPSTYIWAVASDKSGDAYAATGSPATVLRIARDGKSTTMFKTKDMSVQAVAVGPDGSVYAATLPNGKVYRIPAGSTDLDADKAIVVFDPAKLEGVKPDAAPKYIWDLAFGPDGALYIATGGPAAVYRVRTPAGDAHVERFSSRRMAACSRARMATDSSIASTRKAKASFSSMRRSVRSRHSQNLLPGRST